MLDQAAATKSIRLPSSRNASSSSRPTAAAFPRRDFRFDPFQQRVIHGGLSLADRFIGRIARIFRRRSSTIGVAAVPQAGSSACFLLARSCAPAGPAPRCPARVNRLPHLPPVPRATLPVNGQSSARSSERLRLCGALPMPRSRISRHACSLIASDLVACLLRANVHHDLAGFARARKKPNLQLRIHGGSPARVARLAGQKPTDALSRYCYCSGAGPSSSFEHFRRPARRARRTRPPSSTRNFCHVRTTVRAAASGSS